MKKVLSIPFLLFAYIILPAQQTVGLFQNDSLSLPGYTLFAPNGGKITYLIDNCGRIVNQWTSLYAPGQSAYLLEDGSLLRTARSPNGSFSGGGSGGRVERYDWNGSMTWAFDYSSSLFQQHHDICYMPNGHILLLARELKTPNEALLAGRDPSMIGTAIWPEHVVEIVPVGNDSATVVWRWNLWDHLVQDVDSTRANYGIIADHPERINLNYFDGTGNDVDFVHANAIDYNPALDQIMICSRNYSELWVIDHSTSTAEAATSSGGNSGKGGDILYRYGNPEAYGRGTDASQQTFVQHNAHWIAPGLPGENKIMIFNNGQGRPAGNYSSIDVIDPPVDVQGNYSIGAGAFGPASLSWTYVAPVPTDFYAMNISGAQRLANGNTLICEGPSGHLFEVDSLGVTHWDYISPVSQGVPVSQGTTITNNTVFRAYRYGIDFPAFAGFTLTPGLPVEDNPLPSTCVIFSENENQADDALTLINTFVNDVIHIKNETGQTVHAQIIDCTGRTIRSTKLNGNLIDWEIESISNGMYFLQLQAGSRMQVTRFVKG